MVNWYATAAQGYIALSPKEFEQDDKVAYLTLWAACQYSKACVKPSRSSFSISHQPSPPLSWPTTPQVCTLRGELQSRETDQVLGCNRRVTWGQTAGIYATHSDLEPTKPGLHPPDRVFSVGTIREPESEARGDIELNMLAVGSHLYYVRIRVTTTFIPCPSEYGVNSVGDHPESP